MYLVYCWHPADGQFEPPEVPDFMRGPFHTLKDAFRGVEVLKADMGNDNPLTSFICSVHLLGAGPHSAGRMCIDFMGETSGLCLRIVEFV